MTERICCERWTGPRVEVADSSVIHVCTRAEHHEGPCVCGCGADSTNHRHHHD